jgi:hypothetical protein
MAPNKSATLCGLRLFPENDDGTLCRASSPAPGYLGRLTLWPDLHDPDFFPALMGANEVISNADKAEFKIIKSMPVLNSKRRPYKDVNAYVADRTNYFGAPSTYASFAIESDTELANTKWVGRRKTVTLRSLLEFGGKAQTEKQKIFYRWVRKAYEKKYGEDVNAPELIRKGMSKELAAKIAEVRGSIRVKKAHEEQFSAGGFNPRPIKYNHHYLLGTLSEHATGMAVDIQDKQNPQLTNAEWAFIQGLAGKRVTLTGRWATEEQAEALWKDIQEVDDLFVKKIAAEVSRLEKERAAKEATAKAAAEKAGKPIPPLVGAAKPVLMDVLGKHYGSLAQWSKTGFFSLPLELVLELQAHGFKWGATFGSNVDLHHFELPAPKDPSE